MKTGDVNRYTTKDDAFLRYGGLINLYLLDILTFLQPPEGS